jgi:hypothetical protein
VVVLGDTNPPYVSGSVFIGGIIDGSHGGSDSGKAFHCFPSIKNSVIHDLSNGILPCGHGEISSNLVYNINRSFSYPNVHENFLETLIADGPGCTNPGCQVGDGKFYIHDNVFHTGVGEAAFLGNPGETDYVWNNIWYDLQGNAPHIEARNGYWTGYYYNNTVVPNSGGTCFIHVGSRSVSVTLANNHCITTGALTNGVGYVLTGNLLQTPTMASSQGFNSSQVFAYSPTSNSNSIVDSGLNLSGQANGMLAGLINDTNYACSIDSTNHVVCPARTTTARPAIGPWDVGVYQFSSGGTMPLPPPIVGDFNSDGLVNSIDLSLLTGAWNTSNSTYDLNRDGLVNSLDYTIMVQNWSL